MYKMFKFGLISIFGVLTLSGCSPKIDDISNDSNGFSNVISGKIDKDTKVTWENDLGDIGEATIKNNEFTFTVFPKNNDQKIKITATKDKKETTKDVTVNKGNSLIKYDDFISNYNSFLSSVPDTKSDLLVKSSVNGMETVNTGENTTLQLNVNNGNILGISITTTSFTDTNEFAEFIVSTASAIGCDDYLDDLAKAFANSQKDEKETTVVANGIVFDFTTVGTSLTYVLIYIK